MLFLYAQSRETTSCTIEHAYHAKCISTGTSHFFDTIPLLRSADVNTASRHDEYTARE